MATQLVVPSARTTAQVSLDGHALFVSSLHARMGMHTGTIVVIASTRGNTSQNARPFPPQLMSVQQ